MERQGPSVRRMSAAMFLFLLPLALALSVASIVQVVQTWQNEQRSAKVRFEELASQMDTELDKTESYLANMLLQDKALYALNTKIDDIRVHTNRLELYEAFGSYLGQNENLLLLAVYCANTGVYLERDSAMGTLQPDQRMELRSVLQESFPKTCLEGQVDTTSWHFSEIAGRPLLCRVMTLQGRYGLCAVDLTGFVRWAQENDTEFALLLRQQDGSYVVDAGLDTSQLDSLQPGDTVVLAGGRQLAVGSSLGDLELIGVTRFALSLRRTGLLALLLAGLALLAVITIPLYFRVWKKRVLQPLDVLKQTMQDISTGNLQSRAVSAAAGSELKEINDTFNQMMEEIHRLKIDGYEKELHVRQTQLEYYRLQIRPHFFLNCLKNLYALAARSDTGRIEQSILLLSEYLRYLFRQMPDGVLLRDEILQCQNYVDLFSVSASYPPELVCNVDEEVQDARIPAVSLLTFIENTLRHAPSSQQVIHITVTCRALQLEQGPCLHVCIQDDGPGFTPQALDELNRTDWDSGSEHVGIQNVVQRLRLMLQGDTHILFYNKNGAVVELFAPLERRTSHEVADRG